LVLKILKGLLAPHTSLNFYLIFQSKHDRTIWKKS